MNQTPILKLLGDNSYDLLSTCYALGTVLGMDCLMEALSKVHEGAILIFQIDQL